MVTLFVTTALLIGIGSYLLLIRAQYVLSRPLPGMERRDDHG